VGSRVWSVPLPPGAEGPYEVYVNGRRAVEGDEYTIEGRWVRFSTPLRPKVQLGLGRRIMLGIGIGVYGDLRADVVDVSYRAGGLTQLANDLPVIPPTEDAPPIDNPASSV
jgi:hypothetical protein